MEDQARELLKLLSAMLAKFEQREARMQATVDGRLGLLHDEMRQLQQRIEGLVESAGGRISEQARTAVAPAAIEYADALAAASARVRDATRTIWTWHISLAVLALLFGLVGWGVLHYYQRELRQAKDELARYENALPVLRAFHASDAILCGDRICANMESGDRRHGDAGQYRPVRRRRPE